MGHRVFSDEELKLFFDYKENERKRNPDYAGPRKVIDLYYNMQEHLDFIKYEIGLFLKHIKQDPKHPFSTLSSVLTEQEIKRVNRLSFLWIIGGSVDENPPELICPECKSPYVAEIEYGYLTKKDECAAKHTYAPTPLHYNNGDVIDHYFQYHCLACGYQFGDWRKDENKHLSVR